MIKIIIKKELQDIVGSQKFIWSFLITSILILLTFYVAANNYHLQLRQHEAALSENIRQMEGLTDWVQIKHHVFLPPNPLYTLVNGIDNDIGRNIEMFALGELTPDDSRYMEDPLFATFRFLDLRFLFVIVLTLFAILFGYDLVNGEKEKGTLRLVFANALPKDKFILGKMTGALLAVCGPLLLPLLLGCLLLVIMGVPMDGEAWLRLAMIVGIGLLLFSLFLVLSIFFSSLTPHTANSFLYMIVIWIFLVLIWPRGAIMIAGRAVEVPGIDEVSFEKATYRSQLWKEDMQKINAYSPDQSGDVESMMSEFQKFMARIGEERNEKSMAFNEEVNRERRNRQGVQRQVAFAVSRLSPVSEFTLAATVLAGTGLDMKEQFIQDAHQYQNSYASFLRERVDGMLPGAGVIMRTVDDDDQAEPIDPREVPQFTPPGTTLSSDFMEALLDISLLLVFNIVVFGASIFSFIRFDVR